ncbi:hypothetical protein Mal64_08910 [Pseudobythopirellula maris]|uniref:LTD domain-containing protein n=1 Tax=Pseudobythopirellula maris TaxID=2527991 RepID=A0A5C5ZTC8_9BACT|nr:lamin tail domain-containing protein [Pseudobythopirellula maris]TWT90500.1 hypothetical protein Mal64_08910 [Pseudobythopirellula maris]
MRTDVLRSACRGAFALLIFFFGAETRAQLIVTEIMQDPHSADATWEWVEVYNPGSTAVDLAGYLVDRVGDAPIGVTPAPVGIRTAVIVDDEILSNTTVVPAGGVAVLYDGPALGYDAGRFRNAWPSMPAAAALIGVESWPTLTNQPAAPGLSIGFWADEAAYRSDVADLGEPADPDYRVAGTGAAAFEVSYRADGFWPLANNAASIAYDGVGSPAEGASWTLSVAGGAGATRSTASFLSEPINGPDRGSPGVAPAHGQAPRSSLQITEVMYDPASRTSGEWEWVEVYNPGDPLDFSEEPYWIDDDDFGPIPGPNVTAGVVGTGEVAVLYNTDDATLGQMRAAWQTDDGPEINFIPVRNWPELANGGDLVGLWRTPLGYLDGQAGGELQYATSGVIYDNTGDWPRPNDADSIAIADLGADRSLPTSWTRASDTNSPAPASYVAAEVLAPGGLADNLGMDVGSPGVVPETLLQTLPGDYNNDGRVDAADFTVWRDGLGVFYDEGGYATWVENYGESLGEANAATVPEPATAVLANLALATAAVAAGRRRAGNHRA